MSPKVLCKLPAKMNIPFSKCITRRAKILLCLVLILIRSARILGESAKYYVMRVFFFIYMAIVGRHLSNLNSAENYVFWEGLACVYIF